MNRLPDSEGNESSLPTNDRVASQVPTAEGPSLHARHVVANRYEILSKLGKGGMGEVWHAFDLKLRVDVALKSLRVDLKRSQDPVEALRREVRTAREVISPNVCRIFDLVVEAEQELISMEYIDGITLTAMLIKKGPLELRAARDLAAQFLAGLEAIHQAGLVHRDLKPENIMITRTGRVVVMDFGIAKQTTQVGGTISGTPPYMSPEQLAGEKVDARSDVFSAGVVLAEMIHPEGVFSQKTREEIWIAVRKHPMQLPESPWKEVIARAVASNPDNRFQSAGALTRALEEVTQRVDTIEERKPYPGLASFSAADAEYFFGRELEVETVIKKLQQLHLMALIGPSGAGKTSFLRAGLIPALQTGWGRIFCVPGDSPVLNLAQALVPELSGDTEAMQQMLRFDDLNVALSLLSRWRKKHTEAVLVLDRFEELFTLNSPQVQSRFAELVAKASLEADVRVLLTMRDDFLLRCHDFPALAPVFSELTPLGPLTGAALRRALVQPALKAGYRFEDENMVDEILADVEKERGALPLMAFAAARLWDKRDRETGQLRREAYKEVGGVAGALAQHAEATMEKIGTERHPIAREIFRNLITAQNTRAARDTEELLSIFQKDPGGRAAAEDVLRSLIDSRLVTSFEAPKAEGEKPIRRVEIIHESLLSNWPRLVRWQTQDADSAQLRDQLRQAAQLWEQRSRSEDLLWTGAAFLEYQVWRERYPGGLTTSEEAFAHAMMNRATRRRRQRRIAVAAIFVILLSVLTIISSFWRRSEVARQNAVMEARRAEAGKLLAFGQGVLEADPSRAVAFALAATELADTPDSRLFAMKALWSGPISLVKEMSIRHLSFADFSRDGKWLVVGGVGGVQVLARDGSPPLVLSDHFGSPRWPVFSPKGEFIIWRSSQDMKVVKVWSLSQKKIIRELRMEGFTSVQIKGGKAFLVTDLTGQMEATGKWGQTLVRTWGFNRDDPKVIGHWNREAVAGWEIDPKGKLLAYGKGSSVYTRSLDHLETSPETIIGKHTSEVTVVSFHPNGEQIASGDSSGEIRIWPVTPHSNKEARTFLEKDAVQGLFFDPSGTLLAIKVGERTARLRDLSAPSEAESRLLFRGRTDFVNHVAFHPTDPVAVVVIRNKLLFYPVNHKYPYIFRASGEFGSWEIGFTPDGRSLVTAFPLAPIQLWPVPGQAAASRRNLWEILDGVYRTAIDPLGRYILATSGDTHLISLQDGTVSVLPKILGGKELIVISTDGKLAAAAATEGPPENLGIEIWDLENKSVRLLQKSKGGSFWSLEFSPDGSIFSGDKNGNLTQWDLRKNTGTVLAKGKGIVFDIAVSGKGGYVVAAMTSYTPEVELERATSELILYDLSEKKLGSITSHGNRVCSVAFDRSGKILVTGDLDGIVRVGPITGEPPHLLLGSETAAFDVAVHPAGKWIASAERGRPIVRLWSMPEGKPFHTLTQDDFVKHLRALTNVRVVADKKASTGYRIDYAPFPGWEKVPTWW